MKEILVRFAPCGHIIICEECYKLNYENKTKKCTSCSKEVKSYIKKIFS